MCSFFLFEDSFVKYRTNLGDLKKKNLKKIRSKENVTQIQIHTGGLNPFRINLFIRNIKKENVLIMLYFSRILYIFLYLLLSVLK